MRTPLLLGVAAGSVVVSFAAGYGLARGTGPTEPSGSSAVPTSVVCAAALGSLDRLSDAAVEPAVDDGTLDAEVTVLSQQRLRLAAPDLGPADRRLADALDDTLLSLARARGRAGGDGSALLAVVDRSVNGVRRACSRG